MPRRALLGPNAAAFPTLAHVSILRLVGILAAFALVMSVSSFFTCHWALHRAKEKGLIDLELSY